MSRVRVKKKVVGVADDNRVKIEWIRQICATVRHLIWALAFCGSVGFVCWTVVKVTDMNPWLKALTVICATVAAGFPQAKRLHEIRAAIKNTGSRLASFEREKDPERESSGLEVDGRYRDDL